METNEQVHASAAHLNGKAVLILGQSGAGKSALLLELLALGFTLIADDMVILRPCPEGVWASAPPQSQGRMEIRGVGLFQAREAGEGRVELVIDLDQEPSERLPERIESIIFDTKVLKFHAKGLIHIAQTIFLMFSKRIDYLEPDTQIER